MPGSSSSSTTATSSLWLLEAKAFAEDDRSPTAYSVKYWLTPGGPYIVGRMGADICVEEDKSISRKHAELTVPRSMAAQQREGEEEEEGEESGPHVLVKGRPRRAVPCLAACRVAGAELRAVSRPRLSLPCTQDCGPSTRHVPPPVCRSEQVWHLRGHHT